MAKASSTRVAFQYLQRKADLSIGDSMETKGRVRLHRYADVLYVFDLTNAGKRGKSVERFAISWNRRDDKANARTYDLVDEIEKGLSYYSAFALAKAMFSNLTGVNIYESKLKGIEVAPAGFKPIKIHTDNVYIEADYDSFTVRDLVDQNNLPTCIPSSRGKKTSVYGFYRWLSDNQSRVKGMSYSEILTELRKNGIDYHSYCAMD